ncbi:unnamed protein product, partial [Effrenium voratum]
VRRGLAGSSFSFSTCGGAGRPDGMHRVLPSRSLGYHARSLGLLVLLPFSAFSSLVVLCGFCLHSLPNLFWALATVYLLLSLLFLVVRQDESSPKYWNNLGGLLFLSTMLGCGCGLWNSRMTYKYWAYQGQAKYENVKASNRATSFLDAGSLSFREDVRVDVDSAIGYSEGASTFCVAPLVDKDSTGAVQFWAAGADCCEEGFRCGATKGRLQGLVFLEDAKFTNNMVRELRAAAKAAESKHKLRGAKDALFVALVDPAQVRSFWATARMFMICACVMDFVLCLLVGLGLHCRAKELRSRLRGTIEQAWNVDRVFVVRHLKPMLRGAHGLSSSASMPDLRSTREPVFARRTFQRITSTLSRIPDEDGKITEIKEEIGGYFAKHQRYVGDQQQLLLQPVPSKANDYNLALELRRRAGVGA